MKNLFHISLIAIVAVLTSCGSAFHTADGYENDDAYYTPGEADRPRYTDYKTEEESQPADDDYYSEERSNETDGGYVNDGYSGNDQRGSGNTYNTYNYYRYRQSPFYNSGFYDPVYSSAWYNPINSYGPTFGWNVRFGWNVGYAWGSPCYSWYRRPCFMWGAHNPYTPYWNPYDPFFANTYYSPYYAGYYGYGYGYAGYNQYHDGGSTGYHYGHRTPVTANANINSNYSGGSIYAVRKASDVAQKDPRSPGNVPSVFAEKRPATSKDGSELQRSPSDNSVAQNIEQRKPQQDNSERGPAGGTEYYQWKPSSENGVERKPQNNTTQRPTTTRGPVDRQPNSTSRPDVQRQQPDYRPSNTTNNRPERNSSERYRDNSNSRTESSPGLLDLFRTRDNSGGRDNGARNNSRDNSRYSNPSSRPSTQPSRDRGNNRPSYSQPSRSRGSSASPSRSGGSRSSGSSGGSSRSRGGGGRR